VFGFYNQKKKNQGTCPIFMRFSSYKIVIAEKLIFFSPHKKGKTQFGF